MCEVFFFLWFAELDTASLSALIATRIYGTVRRHMFFCRPGKYHINTLTPSI
jgi:hypothetical protein